MRTTTRPSRATAALVALLCRLAHAEDTHPEVWDLAAEALFASLRSRGVLAQDEAATLEEYVPGGPLVVSVFLGPTTPAQEAVIHADGRVVLL